MGTHPIFESDFDCLTDVKMNDVVFSKRLKVLITSDTTRTHFVTLDIERSKEVRSDVYNLRLTDPDDFFFLFTCIINENEFHQIKNDQQLTIDYQSFSSVLIELLNECHLEESRDHPSKRLELSIETLRSTLSIVEPRRIRNITELKLFFTPADDAQQKGSLAKSLKKYQTETAEIERDRINQIDQLEDEIKNVKNQNCQLQRENDELRNRQKIQVDEVKNQAENKLNSERENYINEIRDKDRRYEERLKEAENTLKGQIRKLENRVSELQRLNDDFLHQKTRAENTVREQKIRIDNMTNEQNRINFENEKNQESKEELNRQNTSRLEKMSQLKAELAAKSAEVNECRNNQTRLERQLQISLDQKAQTDEKFQRLQSQASQLSGDNEQLTGDLTKANEILHRKIDEIKQRQEEILYQKDQDLKALGLRIKDNEDKKSKLENDLELIQEEKNNLESSLKLANGKIQQNDKVISYLNKQLNQMPLMNSKPNEGYIPINHHSATIPTSISSRSIVTIDLRIPKDQSTPISRLNRSDENQLNSRTGQPSSGSTLTQTQLATPVADIQLSKPSNLPKPSSSTTHKQPLMPKLPINSQPSRSSGILGGTQSTGLLDSKYLTASAPVSGQQSKMGPSFGPSAYFSSANGGAS